MLDSHFVREFVASTRLFDCALADQLANDRIVGERP
jgi:hypothetical protein